MKEERQTVKDREREGMMKTASSSVVRNSEGCGIGCACALVEGGWEGSQSTAAVLFDAEPMLHSSNSHCAAHLLLSFPRKSTTELLLWKAGREKLTSPDSSCAPGNRILYLLVNTCTSTASTPSSISLVTHYFQLWLPTCTGRGKIMPQKHIISSKCPNNITPKPLKSMKETFRRFQEVLNQTPVICS